MSSAILTACSDKEDENAGKGADSPPKEATAPKPDVEVDEAKPDNAANASQPKEDQQALDENAGKPAAKPEPTEPATSEDINATSTGDKEPEQTKLDSFVKDDATDSAKTADEDLKASGAIPPGESTDKSTTQDMESKPEPSTEDEPEQKGEQPKSSEAPKADAQPSVADYTKSNGKAEEDKSADDTSKEQSDSKPTNGDAIKPEARTTSIPSSILEKGIVYFFFRARVNTSSPADVNDIARSYMILRPLPKGAALTSGPIPDDSNCRLIAIPKKVLPLSGKDRFMAFVESTNQSFKDLKSSFLSSSSYATKTQGTSHSPAATPIAEGVYALTTDGKDSHFAYMTTLPATLGEVQKDVGIKDQGSFAVSAKNPKFPGPQNAQIGKDPEYSSEIMESFRDLRWGALKPEMLGYKGCQFLLIGESEEKGLEQLPRDEKKGLEEPKEEMEKLEEEDEVRVRDLKGDDAVFADLGVSKKEYPGLLTSWDS
jgi:hypothetical protein